MEIRCSVKYVALSPPAEEEDILATIKPCHFFPARNPPPHVYNEHD
jgi:hypothetical protein